MKRYFFLYILIILMIIPQGIIAQNSKPKVALVLSGGGAKGLAHIPVLQALDSLGIVPDLVVGTSMGSIVGGLYAMGYSGDSIAILANNANWEDLLFGDVSMDVVGVEEKSEFDKYLIDLDIVDGTPKPTASILNDQNIREFFSQLIYPVFNVNNFDKLQIPYRAVATDIVNGKEVIIDHGSLSFAMRASLSIPGVFNPVPYENTLLVDGGVLNNFPTDVAKEMGADIIIGSDVGGGMKKKKDLDNVVDILFQTSMLTSNMKNPINRKYCNVLVDHTPYLSYETKDFDKSHEIYDEGKIATSENILALKDLAQQLKNYPQRTIQLPIVKDEIVLDTIIFKNISKGNLKLVKARANFIPHQKQTTHQLLEGLNRARGTNLFHQITYNPFFENDLLGVELIGFEKSRHQVKGSAHYDMDRGVGILFNYTGRNILGNASRFLISADIAKQPRLRIQNQNNFGKQKNWWWRSDLSIQHIEQEYFVNGQQGNTMKLNHSQFNNQINKNINYLRDYVGIGLNHEVYYLRPSADPQYISNIYNIKDYQFNLSELYTQYTFNTLNKTLNAKHGSYLKVSLNRSIRSKVDVTYYEDEERRAEGKTNGYTRFDINYEKRITKNSLTSIINTKAGYYFMDYLNSGDISFLNQGYMKKYLVGGNLLRPLENSHVFEGLHEAELIVSQFTMFKYGLQINPFDNFYITPHTNLSIVGFHGFSDYITSFLSPNGNWQDMNETSFLMSAGSTVCYDSFLGPISFDVSWVNNINKVRVSFSMGIQFNRSN